MKPGANLLAFGEPRTYHGLTSSGKSVVVVDLDGTLANLDHRVPMVTAEAVDWDAFYKASVNDTPNEWCVSLILSMASRFRVIILTARSKIVEKETREWLEALFPPYYAELVMLREPKDHTPDLELKRRWLKKFGKDQILFVVEDRQRVVDMWREEGLVCLQCYAWPEVERKRGNDH
jgi:FMN phosphatase YigB (HAD superfamily)